MRIRVPNKIWNKIAPIACVAAAAWLMFGCATARDPENRQQGAIGVATRQINAESRQESGRDSTAIQGGGDTVSSWLGWIALITAFALAYPAGRTTRKILKRACGD